MFGGGFLRKAGCALAVACAIAPAATLAGSFSVVPVRVLFAPRDRAVAVTLTNLADTPVVLGAELYQWEQKPDGSDHLTPSEDLVLAPPLIRLAPKAQQVVRLALLRAPDPQTQLTFRMIVREQPQAGAATPAVNIPVSVAMSLPVFVTPPGARWDIDCTSREAEVRCTNSGTATALVRSARLEQGGKVVARFDGGAYLLPGASRPIALQPKAGGPVAGKLTLVFEDDQTAEFELR